MMPMPPPLQNTYLEPLANDRDSDGSQELGLQEPVDDGALPEAWEKTADQIVSALKDRDPGMPLMFILNSSHATSVPQSHRAFFPRTDIQNDEDLRKALDHSLRL